MAGGSPTRDSEPLESEARAEPLPEGLLVLRRGVAALSLGLLPEKETGRLGVLGTEAVRRRRPQAAQLHRTATNSKEQQEKKMS